MASVFCGLAGYVVISSIADPPTQSSVYTIENAIDQNLLPELDEDKKNEAVKKPIKITEIPKKDTFKPKTTRKPDPKPIPKPKLPVKQKEPIRQVKKTIEIKPPAPVAAAIIQKPVDSRIALRRQYNMKRRQFSKVSYTTGTPTALTPENLNRQDQWPVKTDTNTYPTDLSRVVTKEKFISAILNNRIESTFGGNILLTIDHNVYGAHGNKILIPIGTKASGKYLPVEEIGVSRLSMTIERMVTPDGQLILFKNPAVVADKQGAAGVTGEVDNKYLQKFGLPLAFSVANNTTNLLFQRLIDSMSDPEDQQSSLSQVFNEQWSRDQSATNREIISDIIKNNIKIMPTISIEPGSKILLFLDHDIWFMANKNGHTEVVQANL